MRDHLREAGGVLRKVVRGQAEWLTVHPEHLHHPGRVRAVERSGAALLLLWVGIVVDGLAQLSHHLDDIAASTQADNGGSACAGCGSCGVRVGTAGATRTA